MPKKILVAVIALIIGFSVGAHFAWNKFQKAQKEYLKSTSCVAEYIQQGVPRIQIFTIPGSCYVLKPVK